MKGKGRYLIWSMVLALIGIILLIVACETGAFSRNAVAGKISRDNSQIQQQEEPGSQKDVTERSTHKDKSKDNPIEERKQVV